MPRGFSSHTTGPMRTGGGFTAPVNDAADATLRANAQRTNSEPFTPEHVAAYHAFANVTDRKDALALHQGHVSWDDVNEYGETGMSYTNYRLMIEVRRDGVTPAVLRTWKAVHTNLSYAAIGAFTKAGLTPAQVTPYILAHGTSPAPITPVDFTTIPDLITRGVSATRAHHYRAAGIPRATEMIVLHRAGCRPRVVYANRATLDRPLPGHFATRFVIYYCKMARAAGNNTALVHALVTVNATVTDAAAWKDTNAPADRVGLLLLAGITPTEYTANPHLADDAETLAAMAALRGHTTDLPALPALPGTSVDSLTLAV